MFPPLTFNKVIDDMEYKVDITDYGYNKPVFCEDEWHLYPIISVDPSPFNEQDYDTLFKNAEDKLTQFLTECDEKSYFGG